MMQKIETYSQKLKQRELNGRPSGDLNKVQGDSRTRYEKEHECLTFFDLVTTATSQFYQCVIIKMNQLLSFSSVLGQGGIQSPRKENWIGRIWVPCSLPGFRRERYLDCRKEVWMVSQKKLWGCPQRVLGEHEQHMQHVCLSVSNQWFFMVLHYTTSD